MLEGFDLSHPEVLAGLFFLTISCSVLLYKIYRRKRPGKHTPWSRLYDRELH
jgi:hypothetical protein